MRNLEDHTLWLAEERRAGPGSPITADYSLEMTAKDTGKLEEARASIRPGTQVSITFLPGEEFPARVAAAAELKRLGLKPVPHLSARRLHSLDELDRFLANLEEAAAIDRAFVVAGDPRQPLGPFEDSLALIRTGLLEKYGIRQVGISGYPEGHPDIAAPALWQALRDKHRILADLGFDYEITTQFGFDSEPVLAWLARLRDEGITAVVRVGIAGPASVNTLLRYAARCGVGASTKVLAKYGVSITRLLQTAGPEQLIDEFAGSLDPDIHGEVRLHFYPFGGLAKTARWIETFEASLTQS